MFRMSFDWSILENVEEQHTICVHAYADSSQRMQLVFMHMRRAFMCTWTYLCVHISVLKSICTWFPTYIRPPHAYVCRHEAACAFLPSGTLFLTPVSSISYPNANLRPFFHLFVGFVPIFRQGKHQSHGGVVQGPYCRNEGLYSCSGFWADCLFATKKVY